MGSGRRSDSFKSGGRKCADLPGFFVVGPAGAGQIPPDDALHRQGLGFPHQHGAAGQHFPVGLAGRGKIFNFQGDEVIGTTSARSRNQNAEIWVKIRPCPGWGPP